MFAHKVTKNAIIVLFSIFFLFFVDLMCLTETKYVPIAIFLTINTHILKVLGWPISNFIALYRKEN